MAKGFKSPGPFAEFIALLEEFHIFRPITGRAWGFDEAFDRHFPPLPDWMVNGLALLILAYSLIQLRFLG